VRAKPTWKLREEIPQRPSSSPAVGLLEGKRAIVIESRGGYYSEGATKALDSQEPHLRTLLGFVGIKDATFIRVEKLAFGPEARAELKRFGIDVVVAPAGNMKTGGPAKTAAALMQIAGGMTPEQRELYGHTFETFATALNGMQNSGLDSVAAARRVIDLAEQVPAPSRAPVGPDAEEILRLVRVKSDAEQDALRLQLVGLS